MPIKMFTFTDTHTQVPGSVAAGLSNHKILPEAGSRTILPAYKSAIFGFSVSGSSGNFGMNIMGILPDGTTAVVAGTTGLAGVKQLLWPVVQFEGTTFSGLIPRPYEIQYQRAVGTSIAYVAQVWGILSTE